MADRPTELAAGLRPSSSDKWTKCAGYPNAVAHIPSSSTIHTAGGTAEHEMGETCIVRGYDPSRFLGVTINAQGFDIAITQERVEMVRQYVDYCRELTERATSWACERKLDLSCIHPAIGSGTTDFEAYFEDEQLLEIVDYKGGGGMAVSVVGNTQFLHYAAGAVAAYKGRPVKRIRMTVVQPRIYDEPQHWDIDVVDLWDAVVDLTKAAEAALDPNAPRTAGEHCNKFCGASGTCPAYRAAALSVAKMEFADAPSIAPDELSPDEMADILEKASILEGWIKAVRGQAMRQMECGKTIPRHKLVAKAARRKWEDPYDAAKALIASGLSKDEIYGEAPLRSPAQVEKLLPAKVRKEVVGPLTIAESSGWTLVHEQDSRQAITPNDDEFTDITE